MAYAAPRAGRVRGRVDRGRRRIPVPVLVVLATLLVVTVVSKLPIILVGLLVWFLVASRHGHPGSGCRP